MADKSWTFSGSGTRTDVLVTITTGTVWSIKVIIRDKAGTQVDQFNFELPWMWVQIIKRMV